jgi:hypothetical protein
MNDYHEFTHGHEIQIEECWLYWSPSYVSITRGIMAPSGAITNLNNLVSGNNANGNGATRSGGTTEGGVERASIST